MRCPVEMGNLWEEGNSVVSCGNADGKGNNVAAISIGVNVHGKL